MGKWKMVRLGDVCDSISSNIAQKDLANNEGVFPIYGASGLIKRVDFYKQDQEYLAIVKDGAGIGHAMLLPAHSSVISTMQSLLPKNNINAKYLYFAVSSMNLAKYHTGATIPHIYFKGYKEERLPLPPMDDQLKIINVLEKASALIKLRKTQIDKLDLLIKSQFIEMFGDPVANSKEWPLESLGNLGDLNRGVSKHRPRNDPELLDGPYPLIQTGEISRADLYITDYASTYSEIGLAQSHMWPKGTLCITIAANIAQTAILTFDACFPDSVVGFISGKKTNQIYIHYWFVFFQKILEEQAPQVAQKNINLRILNDLNVTVPPIELQKQFVTFVQQVEKSKLAIQQSLEKLELNYKSLMQKCFRGELF